MLGVQLFCSNRALQQCGPQSNTAVETPPSAFPQVRVRSSNRERDRPGVDRTWLDLARARVLSVAPLARSTNRVILAAWQVRVVTDRVPQVSGSSQDGPKPDGHHDDLDPRELERLNVQIPDDPASSTSTERPGSPRKRSRPRLPQTPASTPPRGTWTARRGARRRRLAITAGVVLISMVVVAISGAVGAWIVGSAGVPQRIAPGEHRP